MNNSLKSDSMETLLAWESWAGEVRINLIRMLAIAIFYSHHLIRVYLLKDTPSDIAFEVRVTVLVLSYGVVVAALYYVLRLGFLHPWIKYLVTLWDVLMIAAFVVVMDTPQSVFLMLFLLPIAASALRLSLPLVYFSTISGAIAYLAILAHHAWLVVGSEAYYGDATNRIPRSEQVVVLLVLLTAGLLAGQAVRQVKRIVHSLGSVPSGAA
ncbi:MAG: hypothetical protein MUF23_09280 [Pirellula sp.]|jgi:hypothetical protein|nr:hypothetical protein [Pirellula sp.]